MKLTTYNIEHMESAIKKIKKLQKKIDKELATKFTAQERALIDFDITVNFNDVDLDNLAISRHGIEIPFKIISVTRNENTSESDISWPKELDGQQSLFKEEGED